jgi:hypothetical protein
MELADPCGLFNSSLEGNVRRAIDIHEGDKSTTRRWRRWSVLLSRSMARRKPSAPDAEARARW